MSDPIVITVNLVADINQPQGHYVTSDHSTLTITESPTSIIWSLGAAPGSAAIQAIVFNFSPAWQGVLPIRQENGTWLAVSTNTAVARFIYTIYVSHDGYTYRHDPEIKNQPGGGGTGGG